MKSPNHIAECEPEKCAVTDTPVRVPNKELSPKAQAKAANKLPKEKQLERFEKDLEEHDPGNQPA
jgi:hypothetical protein